MSVIQAFTIVDRRTSKPFTLRVRDRPAVISFRDRRNACYTALAIERREIENFAETDPYTLVSLGGGEVADEDPKHLFLRAYEDFTALLEECAKDESDTMFITSLETSPGEAIEFYGKLFQTST